LTTNYSILRGSQAEPRTILVPLDGSALADLALGPATFLASATSARLVLVRATFWVDAAVPSTAESSALAIAQAQAQFRAARQALEEVHRRLEHAGIQTEVTVAAGRPADVILASAVEKHAYLIAMTTQGYSGIEHMLFGSVADEVVRRATMPILLIPRTMAPGWPAHNPPRVLVLLDGTPQAERIVESVGTMLTLLNGEALLLRVLEPPPVSTYAQLRHDERMTGRRYLEAIQNRLPAGVTIRVEAAVGQPAEQIERVIAAEGPDLIAMATRGRGGMSRLILGSAATTLVRKATTPILLVGPSLAEGTPSG
jgi:nucleotide-binding universal stress UspA family protein